MDRQDRLQDLQRAQTLGVGGAGQSGQGMLAERAALDVAFEGLSLSRAKSIGQQLLKLLWRRTLVHHCPLLPEQPRLGHFFGVIANTASASTRNVFSLL